MNVLDLFSGIGGFSLGLERAGMRTIAFCEIDPFCRKVLRKHWPDVPIYEDIRGLTHDGSVDVITGGFPCQPFSHAGKRQGIDDDRYLWPAMLEVIKTHRPAWVIGENVAGLVSMGVSDRPLEVESRSSWRTTTHDFFSAIYAREEYLLLNRICEDLEQAGYAVQPIVIPACGVDAPHRRDRVWIVANASFGRCSGARKRQNQQSRRTEVKRASKAMAHDYRTRQSQSEGCKQEQRGWTVNGSETLANTGSGGQQRQGPRWYARNSAQATERQTIEPFNGGERSIWLPEPAVGRVALRIPNRMDRLRVLGNHANPQVVEMIGRAIMEAGA